MRSTVNHVPPSGMQAMPADNIFLHVMRQVVESNRGQQLIHTQTAMEIAAWFQTPRNTFAPFASTGTVVIGLLREINAEIKIHERAEVPAEVSVTTDALYALRSYVISIPDSAA